MTLEDPILSICIPTYNRCDLLSQALRAIARQMTGSLSGQVEIIVSDNASPDGTSAVIDQFRRDYPDICLRYIRQSENIGGTRNFYFVTKEATGRFVYLISDDDILLPNALAMIVAKIQAHPDLDAICPGISAFTATPETIQPKRTGNDELIIDRNLTLIRLGTMLTFMSSVAIRQDAIHAAPVYLEKFFPHSFMFLSAIAREKGCLFLSQECLAPRGNETIGYDLIQAFVTDFVAVLRHAKQIGYSQRATKAVLSAHARYVAGFLRSFRKTSYRPNLLKRIGDTAKVTGVWWREPKAWLRIEAAMWLPEVIFAQLVKRGRFCARKA